MWKRPHDLAPTEYELVKYILNNELYDDDGNSIEELEDRIDAYECDTQRQEREIAHMAAVIDKQGYTIDRLNSLLHDTREELALCNGD